MYPPPQRNLPMKPTRPSHQNTMQHTSAHMKAQAAPFAYEYVFEEGKLPFLAELHPSNKAVKASITVPPTHIVSAMKRNKSLKRKEKHPSLDSAMEKPTTTDKLKRALSLTGMKSSHFRSFSTSHAGGANKENVNLPRTSSTRTVPLPNIGIPRPPTLVLPTPSPSPDPEKNNNNNSVRSSLKTINFSLPRSSWASSSEEDQLDLVFLRESALGRLTPSPIPRFEGRRDKAMQVLGLTEFPITPPFTPAASTAPSIHEHHSRQTSRRTSVEYNRLSSHIPAHHGPAQPVVQPLQQPKRQESTSSKRNSQIEKRNPQIVQRKEPVPSSRPKDDEILEVGTGRPALRRKTSRFIEHIDTEAPPSAPASARPILAGSEKHRGMTVPTIPIVAPVLSNPTVPRRSESMRVPSRRHAWGELCTAEARPIVAVGSARLITS